MTEIVDHNELQQVASPSVGGWLATLLGVYLVGSGVFNITQLARGGSSATQQSTEMLRQSGLDASAAPVAIVVSYIVGAPIFLGSGLLALGSIARHVKRSKGKAT
jgi:hypothetical protein